MSKKNIRLLALGFLLSGLLIVTLQGLPIDGPQATALNYKQTLEDEIVFLEDKVTRLEQESERLILESSAVISSNSSLDDPVETNNKNILVDEKMTEIGEFTILVREGDPSSVVASQLEEYGMIDDRHAFNEFLEKNNYARKIRPGEYIVSSEMTREKMIEAIIR